MATFVMSLLGSVCKIRILVLPLLLNGFAESQAVQKFPVWCVHAQNRHYKALAGQASPSVPPLLPEGDKLEEEEDNPALVPIQPPAFSPKAVSKGVN